MAAPLANAALRGCKLARRVAAPLTRGHFTVSNSCGQITYQRQGRSKHVPRMEPGYRRIARTVREGDRQNADHLPRRALHSSKTRDDRRDDLQASIAHHIVRNAVAFTASLYFVDDLVYRPDQDRR